MDSENSILNVVFDGIVILCISGAMPSFVDISVTSSEESEKRVPKFSFALDASK